MSTSLLQDQRVVHKGLKDETVCGIRYGSTLHSVRTSYRWMNVDCPRCLNKRPKKFASGKFNFGWKNERG